MESTRVEVLTEAECRALLAEQQVGRVAFVSDGWPVVLPVNFVIDGDGIAIRLDLGAQARGTPLEHVAFEVDGAERWNKSGWSVLAQGHGQEASTAMSRRYEELRRRGLDTWVLDENGPWFTIDIHRISGRRILVSESLPTSSWDDEDDCEWACATTRHRRRQ